MTHAKAIKTAQMNLLTTRAMVAEFTETLNADFPAPPQDCDDATFDMWNEAYEQAYLERGGFKIDALKTSAENDLIAAMSAWLRSLRSPPAAVIEVLDLIPTRYSARRKCLDLWMRLDARTVGC